MCTSGFNGFVHYSENTKLEIIGINRCNRRFHITEVLILIIEEKVGVANGG